MNKQVRIVDFCRGKLTLYNSPRTKIMCRYWKLRWNVTSCPCTPWKHVGMDGIAPLILNLYTKCDEWSASHPHSRMNRRLGGPHGRFGEMISCPCRKSNHDFLGRISVCRLRAGWKWRYIARTAKMRNSCTVLVITINGQGGGCCDVD
jgi:hypothetical protein